MKRFRAVLSYYWAPLYALLLEIVILYGMYKYIPHTHYAFQLIFERGPVSFIILYSVLYPATTCILAAFRKDYTAKLLAVLLVMNAIPLSLGLLSTALGFVGALSGYLHTELATTDIQPLLTARGNFILGLMVALDPFLLACVLTVSNLVFIAKLGIKK